MEQERGRWQDKLPMSSTEVSAASARTLLNKNGQEILAAELRVFEKQIQTIHYFLLPKDISDVPLTFLDQVRAFLAFFSLNFPESLLKLIQHELRTNLVSLIVLENE